MYSVPDVMRSPSRRRFAAVTALIVALTAPVGACRAGAGPFGIDHEWTYDNSGIWKRSNQNALLYGLIGGEVVGAVWPDNLESVAPARQGEQSGNGHRQDIVCRDDGQGDLDGHLGVRTCGTRVVGGHDGLGCRLG